MGTKVCIHANNASDKLMNWKSPPVESLTYAYKDDVCLLSCNMYMQGVSMLPIQLQAKTRLILLKAEKVL